MHLARTRTLFSLAFIACALIVGAAVYLQGVIGFFPCPLCLVQRTMVAAFGVLCMSAVIHSPGRRGWQVYSGLLLLAAMLGALTAARQVWLQGSPPEDLAVCLANLQNLLDTSPFLNVFVQVLAGEADCSEINWSLFGISIPEWSLLAFAGMGVFAMYYLFIEFRRSRSMDTGIPD